MWLPHAYVQMNTIRLCDIAQKCIDNLFLYFKLDRLSIPIIDIL
jgi:hypothetical protein